MKLLTEMTLAVILTMAAMVAAAETIGIHMGVWTEHTMNDGADLNEKNELIQVTIYGDWQRNCCNGEDMNRYFTTAGRFVNSHYLETQFIGGGREYSLIQDEASIGLFVAAVYGYEGTIDTHFEGVLFVPVVYFDYEFARLSVMGPVTNVGVTYEF